ncbi:Peptidase propeptide and YPEB domain-containing protein [Rhodovulum sp. ES.010]|uniref:PepSY domain-containing protein n=1 Tax=Rhodovulum sp. ES.010 TaxID=1882821 RepID=UPI00092B989F|nr:PepSY domain-containing protein [Rhodovulum sp. ES.010]SIO47697.1 Peptidase propeptide and YPEB domain-containing protein [Rhodovulum sp. ES.010]SIO53201.1 Peptidase propeptide and YPEB domain-containing protein [Rhodovulum sp. ES.010]
MKRTILFTAALASAAGLVALGEAQASPETAPAMAQPARWMPLGELIAKLESQGYTVLEAEREDGRYWEVKMRDANGMVVEAYLDPATGAPATRLGRDDD